MPLNDTAIAMIDVCLIQFRIIPLVPLAHFPMLKQTVSAWDNSFKMKCKWLENENIKRAME